MAVTAQREFPYFLRDMLFALYGGRAGIDVVSGGFRGFLAVLAREVGFEARNGPFIGLIYWREMVPSPHRSIWCQ